MEISLATTTPLANASNNVQVRLLKGHGEQVEAVVNKLLSSIEAGLPEGKGRQLNVVA